MGEAAEFGFDDELRLHPDDVFASLILRHRHGRTSRLEFFEPQPQIARCLARIPGADPPGIAQLTVVMNRYSQRTDRLGLRRRWRETHNDKFLGVVAFALDEVFRTAGAV